MASSYVHRILWTSDTLTLDGATAMDTTGFAPLNQIQIHKIALMATNNAAGGASVIFNARSGASTDVAIGTVVIPAANSQGVCIYKELATPFVMTPGQRLELAVTEGGTAPTAYALIEYSILDAKLQDLASSLAVKTT